MQERIMTLHPEGKEGVNIERAKYTTIRAAILDAIAASGGEIAFSELADAVAGLAPDFDGSYGWYVTTVKLDLEARGEVVRVPGSGPQHIRAGQ